MVFQAHLQRERQALQVIESVKETNKWLLYNLVDSI